MDLYGKLYVWLSMGNYMCGFKWRLTCVDLNGQLYVWVSLEVSMCGFIWRIIRADLLGPYLCVD